MDALQSNGRRQVLAAVIEQRRFFWSANQPARQSARLDPSALVEFAKLRDRLLDHPPPNTNAAHQGPIAMNLAVLLANRMAQVHAPSEPTAALQKIPKVVTTRSNPPRRRCNSLISFMPACTKSRNPPPRGEWGVIKATFINPEASFLAPGK